MILQYSRQPAVASTTDQQQIEQDASTQQQNIYQNNNDIHQNTAYTALQQQQRLFVFIVLTVQTNCYEFLTNSYIYNKVLCTE